jgi:hypothetical protein
MKAIGRVSQRSICTAGGSVGPGGRVLTYRQIDRPGLERTIERLDVTLDFGLVEFGAALVISGVAFLIGGLCGSIWGPSGDDYAPLYLSGITLALILPVLLSVVINIRRALPVFDTRPYDRAGMTEATQSWPARKATKLVDFIARHKASMLATSIGLTIILLIGVVFVLVAGEGDWLTTRVTELGGYVAILAVVLGAPALGYAMVTDHTVDAISAALRESVRRSMDQLLNVASIPADHYVQVFRPNREETLLLPVYDPANKGPEEGWAIDPVSPQAVTGSAWVKNEYFYLRDRALHDTTLGLTPEQRNRYSKLTGVAATPVRDASGKPIAVLTILTSATPPRIGDTSFIDLHIALAQRLSESLRKVAGPLDLPATVPSEAQNREAGSIEITADVIAKALNETPALAEPGTHTSNGI